MRRYLKPLLAVMILGMLVFLFKSIYDARQAPSNEVRDSVNNAAMVVKTVTAKEQGSGNYITYKRLGDNAETTDAVLSFIKTAYLSSDGGKTGKKITAGDGITLHLAFTKDGFTVVGDKDGAKSYEYDYKYKTGTSTLHEVS